MSPMVIDVHTAALGRGMRLRVFDDGDRVSVVRDYQHAFAPKSQPEELWTRYERACKQVFSMRRGALDAYSVSPLGLRTITPWLGDSLADLTHTARSIGEDARAAALSAFGVAILRVAERHQTPVPRDAARRGLYTTLASLAYPLLGQALRDGGVPPPRLPLGVTRTLRARSAAAGAVAAFGKSKTNRAVVRALATNLSASSSDWADAQQRVGLQTLLLASAASRTLDPDRLCALLTIKSQALHPEIWDAVSVRRSVRDLLRIWPASRVLVLAEATLARPDGLLLLADAALAWQHLGRPLATAMPKPRSLEAVHEEVVGAASANSLGLRESVPPEIAELHNCRLRTMTLVLPNSAAELTSWGLVLGNCLASYSAKVARGAACVVGVKKGGHLVYAVELNPAGGIRQFKGFRNAPPDEADVAEVAAELSARGLTTERIRPHPSTAVGFVSLLDEAPF